MAAPDWASALDTAQAMRASPDSPDWAQALNAQQTLTEPRPDAPRGLLHAMKAGWESSATGLIVRGKLPENHLSEDAAWYERALGNVTGLVADVPEMVGGALAGSLAGPLGTAGGAFAAPMAIRGALMKAYEQGGVHSYEDAWNIAKEGGLEGGKGAILGVATAGVGRVAGAFAAPASPLVKGLAVAGAETTTLATGGAALEGRMPTARDFLDAGILVGGLHAATGVAGRLRDVYAKTGALPEDVALAAVRNPGLKEQLLTKDGIPDELKPLAAEENARAAVPTKEDGRPFPSEMGPSPFVIGADKLGEKIPVPKIDPTVIETLSDLEGAVAKLDTLYAQQIAEQTRTPTSHRQSYEEARQILANTLGVLPDRLPGEAVTPSSVLSRAAMADALATDLVNSAKEALQKPEGLSDADVAQILAKAERAGMGHAYFTGAAAEAGRTLNILATVKKTSTQLEMIRQAVEDYGGAGNVRDFIEQISKADNAAATLQMAKRFTDPTLFQKGIAWWKAFQLSGPWTDMANISGNTMGLGVEVAEAYQTAMVNRIRQGISSALGKATDKEAVSFREGTAMLSGIVNGAKDALLLAKDAYVRGTDKTGKLDTREIKYENPVMQKLWEGAQLLSFRKLSAEDVFFRTLGERAQANALAVREALQQGFEPGTEAYARKIQDVVANPSEAQQKEITQAGKEITYTQDLGKMGKHLNLMVEGTPLELILPYRKTPINLFKWAVDRFPGLNLLMEKNRKALQEGGIEADKVYARMMTGAVITGLAYAVFKSGNISGGGFDKTPEQRAAMRAAGWQPYALKINGEWKSIQRFDPVAKLFMATADIMEIANAAESPEQKKAMFAVAVAAIGNATISQTYLSGLGNFVGALSDPQRYGEKFAESYAGSIVPAIVGQVASYKDPYDREINGMVDAIQARIPVWREELLPVRNPLTGEPVKAGRSIAPIRSREASTDPVLTEAVRLGIGISPAPKEIHVGRGTGKIGNVEISPEARNAFVGEQGKFAHEILSGMVGGPYWDALPDMAKVRVYDRVMQASRRNAAMTALPPEARMEAAIGIQQEITKQLFKGQTQ